jgi:hypothetical protein
VADLLSKNALPPKCRRIYSLQSGGPAKRMAQEVGGIFGRKCKMKCWICGNDATTGEHKTKASDLRELFPNVTQKQPIFLHTDQAKNQKIGSVKSDKLKFKARICAECNNVRTATYDRAWESLFKFLREKEPPIREGDLICLDKVFSVSVARSMLYVHLFFVKLFGCIIAENNLPIDIAPFSKAIMCEKPHPKIYIAFGPALDLETGGTNLHMDILNGKCAFATWFYIVGSVLVNVMYAEPNETRQGLIYAWHPMTVSNSIIVAET